MKNKLNFYKNIKILWKTKQLYKVVVIKRDTFVSHLKMYKINGLKNYTKPIPNIMLIRLIGFDQKLNIT